MNSQSNFSGKNIFNKNLNMPENTKNDFKKISRDPSFRSHI